VVSSVLWEGETAPGGNPLVIEDFARAIREGRQPATDLEKALIIARITDAIYASAASGRAVEV